MTTWKTELLAAIDALEIAHIHADDAAFAAEAKGARESLGKAFVGQVGWKPIQTAPRDGTKIDLWTTTNGEARRYADCRWDGLRGTWDMGPLAAARGSAYCRPTHWRPIAGPGDQVEADG